MSATKKRHFENCKQKNYSFWCRMASFLKNPAALQSRCCKCCLNLKRREGGVRRRRERRVCQWVSFSSVVACQKTVARDSLRLDTGRLNLINCRMIYAMMGRCTSSKIRNKEVQWSYHIVGFNRINLTNLTRGLQRQLLKRHWQLLQKQSWKQRDAMTWRIDSESDEA